MIPIKTHKGIIIICFEAEEEDRTMAQHFMGECGWSEEEFNELEDSAWFCAKVSAWKGGEELAAEYLGACCYEKESDFWQEKGGHFDDMVQTLLHDPKVRANFRPLGRLNVEQLSELVFVCGGVEYNTQEVAEALAAMETK